MIGELSLRNRSPIANQWLTFSNATVHAQVAKDGKQSYRGSLVKSK